MYLDPDVSHAVKILIVGHFGVGKTTCIGSLSEIEPLRTEEEITEASVGLDDLSGTPDKKTTTVAMDFGRLTLSDTLVLYLFGTPGQERFKEMWEELSRGRWARWSSSTPSGCTSPSRSWTSWSVSV